MKQPYLQCEICGETDNSGSEEFYGIHAHPEANRTFFINFFGENDVLMGKVQILQK